MAPASFKAGFVQFDVRTGAVADNLAEAEARLAHLADEGAALAVLPEMWSCGFDNANLDQHARRTPEILERLSRLATRHRMVIGGSLPEREGGRIYNTLYLLDADGAVAGAYRKVHLFSVTDEHRYFSAGDRCVVCPTALGPVGLMICYDLRFPELCRTLALQGAWIVIAPAQWPDARIDVWDVLARARAMENQLYIIGANRCGMENNTRFSGHSIIVDPGGRILAHAPGGVPCTGSAVLDQGSLQRIREKVPALEERMPGVYDL
mgnify:CR=1 FL=1